MRVRRLDRAPHRFLALVVGAVVGTVATLSSMASPASAALNSCVGDSSNWHAGASSPVSENTYGARAKIEFQNPDLCGSDALTDTVSVAWSMVTALSGTYPGTPGTSGWAQVGYGDFGDGTFYGKAGIHPFAQYTKACRSTLSCGSGVSTFTTVVQSGGVTAPHFYNNRYSAADQAIIMDIDGTNPVTMTNYNPTYYWHPEWRADFAGETFHDESDVPGVAGNVVTLNYLQRYLAGGSTPFLNSVTAAPGNAPRHKRLVYDANVGGKGLSIWTDPLNNY